MIHFCSGNPDNAVPSFTPFTKNIGSTNLAFAVVFTLCGKAVNPTQNQRKFEAVIVMLKIERFEIDQGWFGDRSEAV